MEGRRICKWCNRRQRKGRNEERRRERLDKWRDRREREGR